MKAVEQQQPNSMDSSDSMIGANEYAYRPLTSKHKRAGSTGTTGDEECTTDEDDSEETECIGITPYTSFSFLKSDLARATTDLFGYSTKFVDDDSKPTSLFDEDDGKINSSYSKGLSVYNSTDKVQDNSKHENTDKNVNEIPSTLNSVKFQNKSDIDTTDFSLLNSTDTKVKCSTIERIKNENSAKNLSQVESTDQVKKDEIVEEKDNGGTKDVNASKLYEVGPPSPTSTRHWEKAVAEVKEHAITKLQEELKRAHEELKLKDEEVTRLSRFRQDVETELEELTANLFQEAHNMVLKANTRQATAERLLEESRMETEVLAAEVVALKTLVLTSTPAQPNPHLHPQIDTRSKSNNSDDGQISLFIKKHRRSPSHFNLKYGRENSPPESPVKEQKSSLPIEIDFSDKDTNDRDKNKEQRDKDRERDEDRNKDKDKDRGTKDFGEEIDPRIHSEFINWKAKPSINKNDPFVARVFNEDINLCLDFPNSELSSKVQQAVLDGIIFIEAISDKTKLSFPKKCALLEVPRQCCYQMRLGDQDSQWYSISQICRNRIIAVCDFLNYLRYVERGLVKSSVHDIYWEITRLRKEMILARLGLALSS